MVSSAGDSFTLRCKSCIARRLALFLAVLAIASSIVTWVLIVLFIVKRRRKSPSSSECSSSPCRYDFSDLHTASCGFKPQNKMGDGSSFSGTLPDGSLVVIKKLEGGSLLKEPAFISHVHIISRTNHQCLLRLRGFCYEDGKAFLVYDYMPHSLYGCLFASRDGNDGLARVTNVVGGQAGPTNSFSLQEASRTNLISGVARFKILQGVASALVHLHENCILHRGVKAANVLLTEDLEPRLGDLGVGQLIRRKQGMVPPCVAPEVVYTRKATEKADVYSFGVLALELACGRPVQDGQVFLIEWVWMLHLSNKLMDALDPCMDDMAAACNQDASSSLDNSSSSSSGISASGDTERQWKCVLHVALLCCQPLLEARPTMRQVAMMLQESIVMPLPASIPSFANGHALALV